MPPGRVSGSAAGTGRRSGSRPRPNVGRPAQTTDDPETQGHSGAPITGEDWGAEVYNTIFAFEESFHEKGLLWAGTDDGKVWVSRNAGGDWSDITPRGVPARGTVNNIELSAHDPGRIFVPVKAFMLDDWQPYVFATSDYGAHWTRLTTGANGIPADTPVRIVREDPVVRGLLYAGTEFGLYVSFDDGRHWQTLQLDLPPIPITDMRVYRNDLVVSTQGRGIYILDDVTSGRRGVARCFGPHCSLGRVRERGSEHPWYQPNCRTGESRSLCMGRPHRRSWQRVSLRECEAVVDLPQRVDQP